MKTTPTLGLKLYDGTDAPDLVSGYNASMGTLDDARIMHYGGTLRLMEADFNSLRATAYYNNDGYAFTADNHGPVGSHEFGILVVYDRCENPDSLVCATQQYFPRNDGTGTGDAYRPMTRALANGAWSEWAPLVEVPDAPTLETLEGKPFSTVGTSLTTRDGALDLSTAAQASLVPEGGAAGQVLSKKSNTDHDCVWVNPSALNNVLSLDSTYGLQQGGTLAPALQVRASNESMVAMNASTQTVQCQQERNVYGALTSSGLTMRNDGGTTSYTVGANGKGILNNITMINCDLPLKVGEEFKLKSNVIGADYKAMSAAFGFNGFNPAIGMGVLRLGSQGVQATCAVRVEASLVGSNLFTIYAVVFEPFINKRTTGFYMSGSATTTSTVDSNIDWGDSIYLTPLTKLKA